MSMEFNPTTVDQELKSIGVPDDLRAQTIQIMQTSLGAK